MSVVARAPGKLVVLGEYAVLAGGTALVMAVDRHCVATIAALDDGACTLRTSMGVVETQRFMPGDASGIEIVDRVALRWPAPARRAWTASLDSSDLYSGESKLGLGSSAAALCAWAGAWRAFHGAAVPEPAELVELHRAVHGGGSGLDVAASRCGGVTTYALEACGRPVIGSAELPEGVAFIATATGTAASTANFVRRFNVWRASDPRAAAAMLGRLTEIAGAGVAAAAANESDAFLGAIAAYSSALEALGGAMDADIVTAEHRAVATIAESCGCVYKVSGAGGGDVGLAFAGSNAALEAFCAAASSRCTLLRLEVERRGLVVEVEGM